MTRQDLERMSEQSERMNVTAPPAQGAAPEGGAHVSLLGEQDLYLFNEGSHLRLWEHLGAHPVSGGVVFGVWAPSAERVSVIGDFNGWDREAAPLAPRAGSGIWESFVDGASVGDVYKFHVVG